MADDDINVTVTEDEINVTIDSYPGSTEFVQLTDTPSSYSSQSLKLLRVNSGETGVEFFTGGAGDVTGPSSAIDENITVFDSTTGKLIKDSGINISDVIANTAARHNAVTIGTANGLSLSTQELSLALATTSTTGALSDTDWDTFNNKQAALTFGIANTNAVQINSASVVDNDYAKFTATGLEGRSYTEVKTDLSLNNVENTAISTWTGSVNLTTLGTIATGTWEATDVGIAHGGTGASTAQAAIDALTQVSGATNEYVLTKDTGTGNAVWKATGTGSGDVTGPGSSTDENLVIFDGATGKIIKDSGTNISAVTANTAKVTNATHTGDVTGSGVLTIAAGAVDIAMLSATGTPGATNFLRGDNQWATPSGSGNVSTSGSPVDNDFAKFVNSTDIEGRSYAEVRTDLNVEDGAEVNNISDANATDLTDAGDSTLHYHATDRARANHTGTQTASTISDFASTLAGTTNTTSFTPSADYHVATKKYVDDNSGGNPLTTKGDIFTYDTGAARLPVGTDGYVIEADSSEATGLKWVANSGGSPLTTKGDLFTYSTVDARLGIGGDGEILIADSGETTGMKWGTPTGSSKWTDSGATTYLTATTDDLAVGGTGSTSPLFMDVGNGTLKIKSQVGTEPSGLFYGSDGTTTGGDRGYILVGGSANPTIRGIHISTTGLVGLIDSKGSLKLTATSVALDAPADLSLLTAQPTGGTDLAIATTKYVDDSLVGASLWTDGGTATYLKSTTDDLALGGTGGSAPFFMDVSAGTLKIKSQVGTEPSGLFYGSDSSGTGLERGYILVGGSANPSIRGIHISTNGTVGVINSYGTLAIKTEDTDAISISATQYVGIGPSATTPAEQLEVDGNIHLFGDSDKMLFGAGKDASIYYDGTDMIFNSQEVGSGDFNFNNGDLNVVNGLSKALKGFRITDNGNSVGEGYYNAAGTSGYRIDGATPKMDVNGATKLQLWTTFIDINDDQGDTDIRLYWDSGMALFTEGSSGYVAVGHDAPDTALDVNGAITQRELSADPADPDEGACVKWMSDGTGSGDDGDIMMKITAGGTTKTTTLVDFSAL